MENVKIEEAKVGKIYTFIPTTSFEDKFYVARVKDHREDLNRVDTTCYISHEYTNCIENGDFAYSIYTCKTPTEIERRKFVEMERSAGYATIPKFRKGDIVRYLGADKADSSDITTCFQVGEEITVIEDNSHATITCLGDNGGCGTVEQTMMATQVEFVRSGFTKFKVGDEIIGNALANVYGVTVQDWIGIVQSIEDNTGDGMVYITVTTKDTGEKFNGLNPDYFDLHTTMRMGTVDKDSFIHVEDEVTEGKLHDKLSDLPDDRWCEEGTEALGRFLANKFDMDYIKPGRRGYAWNRSSFWAITSDSGKIPIKFSEIEHLVLSYTSLEELEFDYPRPPASMNIRKNYYKGDTVRIVRLDHSSATIEMKKQLGQLCKVTHASTDRVYKLNDGWTYNSLDFELYCRGQEGLDADRKVGAEIFEELVDTPVAMKDVPWEAHPPKVPKVFNDRDHVELTGALEAGIEPYRFYIAYVVKDTCDSFVTIEFINDDNTRVQGTVRQKNLRKTKLAVTNSPRERMERSAMDARDFGKGKHVKVVLNISGHPWKKGDIGVIVKVLEESCRVRFFKDRFDPTGHVYKVHKRYIDVTKEPLFGIETKLFEQSARKSHYIFGVDPIYVRTDDRTMAMGMAMKASHIKRDETKVIDRVVKPRHTPNKPDDAYRNKSLVIDVIPVPDRTITKRVK